MAAFAGGELTDSVLPRVALHAEQCSDCNLQLGAADYSAAALLSERYELIRKLGEGGMGVVYEADDRVLGERVALKLLRGELASDERALEYLKSEAKLSRQIGHPHVCRVFDLGSQTASGRTRHYLSMELLRGPSLRSLLAHGALEPGLALRLADQVLCGLQAAHAAGVLHRDLKPDNLLLRYASPHEPHAVITDFGLARAFRAGQCHVTASRTLVGSAAYLAPEQVEEAPLTEATDVYSFGIVLFELLTGEQPFRGETALGVALKRLQIAPRRPSAVRPGLDERYDSFVLRCLAREPRARFQSAAAARMALQRLAVNSHKRRGAALSAFCLAAAAILCPGPEAPNAEDRVVRVDAPAPEQLAVLDVPPVPAAESGAASSSSEPPRAEPPAAQRVRMRAAPSPVKRVSALPKPADVLTADGFLDPFAR